MKYLLSLILFANCNAQSTKTRTVHAQSDWHTYLYCNADSAKKWRDTNMISFGTDGEIVRHRGRLYRDTTNWPPYDRLRRLSDTTIEDSFNGESEAMSVFVTKCDTCELSPQAAFKITVTHQYYTHNLYEDIATHRTYVSGDGWSYGTIATKSYVYVDRNHKPFPTTWKIWP